MFSFSCCAKPVRGRDTSEVTGEEAHGAAPDGLGPPAAAKKPPGAADRSSSVPAALERAKGGDVCKFGCGMPVAPGRTARGNPFDTCCRACVLNQGLGVHDPTCGGKTPDTPLRTRACPAGSKCRDRSEAHLSDLAHPLDEDYAMCCTKTPGVKAETLSLKVIFDWMDSDGSGKLTRKELEEALKTVKKMMEVLPTLTEFSWKLLDEDGNGVVNFGEFAAWAGPRLGLPLGISKIMRGASDHGLHSPCSVIGCPCEDYKGGDGVGDLCKCCKHKRSAHQALHRVKDTGEITFPQYWTHQGKDFNELIKMGDDAVQDFQELLKKTWRPTSTKDRIKHNPLKKEVPASFKVQKVFRNENSKAWQEYACRRAELIATTKAKDATPLKLYEDIKPIVAFKDIRDGRYAGRLRNEVNEWYLFHGTNPEAAKAIATGDFKVSRAGTNTGTLYGKGLYFAESSTKSDEYAKMNDDGNYAVLLVRVLGGNVRYTAQPFPDPEELVQGCIAGPYDSVLGDREKCRNTYREFVLFDSEDAYVEYVVEYKRQYG
eukprot:TRINITY_DN7360_c0_g1_i1.p1 TRINITY_DN7360_c0_g1~~TRINITY_DN7360_c0_g1_i1.p1  ORF type:complete len:543 (+),score=63.90 TRINITY_DN7360_c0_g1_i1:94-1722(+)